jgi:hypothetical protein
MLADRSSLRERAALGMLAAFYAAGLVLAYSRQIAPIYDSAGFTYHPLTTGSTLVLGGLAILPVAWLPLRLERASDFLSWSLFLVAIVPGCLVPRLAMDASSLGEGAIERLTLALVMGFAIISNFPRRSRVRLRITIPRLSAGASYLALISVSLVTYGLSVRFFRGYHLVGFGDVLELREQMTEATSQGGAVFAYLVLAQMHAINPFVIASGIARRRLPLLALGAAGQAFFYLAGGVRAVAFSPVLALGASAGLAKKGRYFALAATALFGFGTLAFALVLPHPPDGGSTGTLVRLMFWRTIVIPAHTMGVYFDFFSHAPVTHFAQVKGFSLFVHNPYNEPIPFVIARYFYGREFSANGNLFAEGFAGWRVPGMLFACSVAGLAFWLLDEVTRDLDRRFVMLAVSFHAVNLSNLSIFTLLLGSGLGASILILGVCSGSLGLQKLAGRQVFGPVGASRVLA